MAGNFYGRKGIVNNFLSFAMAETDQNASPNLSLSGRDL